MVFLNLLNPMGIDFRVYFESAYMILHGLDPYRGIFSSTFPFNYPPPAFLFIFWLGLLPKSIAGAVWNITSLLALIISIWFLLKIIKAKVNPLALFLATFLFTLPFFPVKFNLGNGQINNFILLFSVLSVYFYVAGRKNLSAAFLAYATGIKLAPAIFLLYFIIKKDWAQITRYLIFLIVVFFLPFMFVPWEIQKEYYTHIFFFSFGLGAKDWYYNQSLEGFLARSFSAPWLILGSTYTISMIILVITWWRGRKLSPPRLWSAVSCLYLLIHPIALQHYFGLSIIPLVLLAGDFIRERTKPTLWLLMALSYILISWNIKRPDLIPSDFRFLLSHDFFGVLLLWLLGLFKEQIGRALAIIWISAITVSYIFMLLCRAKVCL